MKEIWGICKREKGSFATFKIRMKKCLWLVWLMMNEGSLTNLIISVIQLIRFTEASHSRCHGERNRHDHCLHGSYGSQQEAKIENGKAVHVPTPTEQFILAPLYLYTCVFCSLHLLGNCICFSLLEQSSTMFLSVSPSSVSKTNIFSLWPILRESSFVFRNI